MEDQRPKTLKHIREVHHCIYLIISKLKDRAREHDKSKLESPEREIFDKYTPKLSSTTYGSNEYKQYLKEMQVGLDHHYALNRHHPEHHGSNPLRAMNLIDIIEMFCDWKAATLRHADGNLVKSIDINQKRFRFSDELAAILFNTVKIFNT